MNNKSCEYCGFVHNVNLHPKCPRCRDAFAMAVLTGMLSDTLATAEPKKLTVSIAYGYADAMMTEREVKPIGKT